VRRPFLSRQDRHGVPAILGTTASERHSECNGPYVDEANELVNAPGSYYAYGRIGMILVAPARKRVYYLYNG
jgi:hypothetical protein